MIAYTPKFTQLVIITKIVSQNIIQQCVQECTNTYQHRVRIVVGITDRAVSLKRILWINPPPTFPLVVWSFIDSSPYIVYKRLRCPRRHFIYNSRAASLRRCRCRDACSNRSTGLLRSLWSVQETYEDSDCENQQQKRPQDACPEGFVYGYTGWHCFLRFMIYIYFHSLACKTGKRKIKLVTTNTRFFPLIKISKLLIGIKWY